MPYREKFPLTYGDGAAKPLISGSEGRELPPSRLPNDRPLINGDGGALPLMHCEGEALPLLSEDVEFVEPSDSGHRSTHDRI